MNRFSLVLTLATLVAVSGKVRAEPAAKAAEGNAETKPRGPGVLTKTPLLTHFVEPTLPPELTLEQPKSVLVLLSLSAEGRVSEAEVVESGGEALDSSALAAAKQLVFEPAEIDGAKAAVRIKYRFDFATKTTAAAAPETAAFTGVVRDQKTKKPLAGVRVELDTGESATTGDDGRFEFAAVTPGTKSVTLSAPTLTPIGTEETLEAGKRYEAAYDVDVTAVAVAPEDRSDFEVVIVATKLGSKISATEVTAEQGSRVAGTGGDVVKVVENLPGVARSTVGSGQLVVWGASAEDTRVYVDGVHLPVLYHEGGFRSVVHSDLVRSVELQPGGYGASYGRGLGGLVTVGLRHLDEPGTHGSAQLDAIDLGASLRTSLGSKWNVAVAGRRSHLDWVVRQVTSENVGEFVPIPKYWDGQVRVAYNPKPGESLEMSAMGSSDQIDRKLSASDPAEIKSESKTTQFFRVWGRYRRETETEKTSVTPFFGVDRGRLQSRFGAVPAELNADSTIYGLRGAYQTTVASWLSVSAGLDAEMAITELSRSGSLTTPPREGDVRVFGQRPPDAVSADTWSVTVAGLAPYVEADVAPFGDKLHIVPGLRVEPQIVRVSRVLPQSQDQVPLGAVREDTLVDPRLSLRWNISDHVTAKAAVGVYHQPPLPADLSAVFGNPRLGPSRARHFLAGALFKLSQPISLEVTSFYSTSSDLSVRSPLSTPALSQVLVQEGRGRAYGTQFLLRHDLIDRFFGWASLSIIRSERTDALGNWRLFDFDQTFVFTALGSYNLGAGFEFGGRFRYSTGYPRTPVLRAASDSRTDAYEPSFTNGDAPVALRQNTYRIPSFYAFDVRLSKRFRIAKDSELEAYLDVQNITNHKNAEEVVYDPFYSKRSYITGLPILPVLGAKLTW